MKRFIPLFVVLVGLVAVGLVIAAAPDLTRSKDPTKVPNKPGAYDATKPNQGQLLNQGNVIGTRPGKASGETPQTESTQWCNKGFEPKYFMPKTWDEIFKGADAKDHEMLLTQYYTIAYCKSAYDWLTNKYPGKSSTVWTCQPTKETWPLSHCEQLGLETYANDTELFRHEGMFGEYRISCKAPTQEKLNAVPDGKKCPAGYTLSYKDPVGTESGYIYRFVCSSKVFGEYDKTADPLGEKNVCGSGTWIIKIADSGSICCTNINWNPNMK